MNHRRFTLSSAALLTILLTLTSVAHADIVVTTLSDPLPPFAGGDYIGTIVDTYMVADEFTTYRQYGDITAQVELLPLGGIGSPTLSFSIMADDNGTPGTTLDTTAVTLTNAAAALYTLTFSSSLILQDATSYWLVASSSAVDIVPIWVVTRDFTGGALLNLNGQWGGSAIPFSDRSVFAINGTTLGDPILNGDVPNLQAQPQAESVPESASIELLLAGLTTIGIAASFRRTRALY
jgi:hypothetical protein